MNEPAAATVPYVPSGHPVRRFVVGIALIAALLGAVWWSGIGRLSLTVEVIETSPEVATIIVTNSSLTSVDLRNASFEDPRLEGESVELSDETLAGGEAIEVTVRFAAACTPTPPGGYYVPLRITAETVLGLDRTVSAGGIATIGDLVCGTDVTDEVGG